MNKESAGQAQASPLFFTKSDLAAIVGRDSLN